MKVAQCCLALALVGCSEHSTAAFADVKNAEARGENTILQNGESGELPYSRGHSFSSLDEYLEYLEEYNGPIDLPYWRKVKPGLYESVSSRPEAQPTRATRAELMRRFGFKE